MMMSKTVPNSTPVNKRGSAEQSHEIDSSPQRTAFFVMAANMSWQLIVVVILPILGGVQLDKHFQSGSVWTLVGVGVAFVLSTAVMWRTVQQANRLPVPKLTDAQRRKIQKSYEKEDDD